jgi:hypothetical protein
MRVASAIILALAALLLLRGGGNARADELLHATTRVNYDVRVDEGDVLVSWDVSLVNNDPETTAGPGTVLFYESFALPVLAGATQVSAESAAGSPLAITIEETESQELERLVVAFDQNLFYGNTYDFHVSYILPQTRGSTLLVTPAYVFLPLVTLGDEADVTLTTPGEGPWSVYLEAAECARNETVLHCSGSDNIYVAGLLEVSRPDATSTVTFDVPLDNDLVRVNLTYFQGEDALAAHQQEIITAVLPLMPEVYGFDYPAPSTVTVRHGGRQSVFGYEGLTQCGFSDCGIVISPGASDFTLVHELAHLWSEIYDERWLSEGFAQWVTELVAERTPDGLLPGEPEPPLPATVPLQLDEWGDTESALGASDEFIARTQAGYALSLRFIQTLAEEVGEDALRDVNQAIADSGRQADSRRYMDALEDVSGVNPDGLFMLWVFPESMRTLVEERREARNRYEEVAAQLAAEGLSEEPLAGIRESIARWSFDEALMALETVEADVEHYFELQADLLALEDDADALGIVVPDDISAAIGRWDFEAADSLVSSARRALDAYEIAREKAAEPRNLWEKFGLIGRDPDGELEKAREAFEGGAFDRSYDRSADAVEMLDDASGAAARRLLIVAGIFSAFAAALGVAYWIALLRQRRLAEP